MKQIAAYTPVTAKKKRRNTKASTYRHGHQHQQVHQHHKVQVSKQDKRDVVTATIDGKVVTFDNKWFGEATAQTISGAGQMVTA